MAKLTQELLERYHDNELRSSKVKEVEKLLSDSPDHQQSLREMARIGDLLRLMNEESQEAVSFDGFEHRVRAGIKTAQAPGFAERLRIWTSEFFEHRQAIWIPSVAVAGAAAAILLILPLFADQSGQLRHPSPSDKGEIWMASDSNSSLQLHSTIELVNFGEATGSKYEISDGQGGTVGVVWIEENPQGQERDTML